MKPFLVDVPVMYCIWTRPDVQRKSFQQIKKARPSKLYLISDGPRNEEEKKLLEESRKICENIDWDCEIHKLYMEQNQGMYHMIKKEFDFVFDREDRCIFLEDDVIASVSFFEFCAELLEKYKNDLRICAINGLNHRGHWRDDEADYFFTLGSAIHGFAMWKRTYELHYRDDVFNNYFLDRELDRYTRISKDDFIAKAVRKSTKDYSADPFANNHPPAIEFYRSFINVTQNQLDIVPTVNMISNIGVEGTHTKEYRLMPKRIKKCFYQKRYEVKFPMRHPQFVIRDKKYEQYFRSSPVGPLSMRIETIANNLRYLSLQELIKKGIRKLTRKKVDEIER